MVAVAVGVLVGVAVGVNVGIFVGSGVSVGTGDDVVHPTRASMTIATEKSFFHIVSSLPPH